MNHTIIIGKAGNSNAYAFRVVGTSGKRLAKGDGVLLGSRMAHPKKLIHSGNNHVYRLKNKESNLDDINAARDFKELSGEEKAKVVELISQPVRN